MSDHIWADLQTIAIEQKAALCMFEFEKLLTGVFDPMTDSKHS